MAGITDLVEVRSQLAMGLEAYLRALGDLTAWPRERFPPPSVTGHERSLLDVYIEQDVFRRDSRRRPTSDREEETFERDGEDRARFRWANERGTHRRAVILGRPGEGKTLLTQLACRELALESLRALRERTVAATDVAVPIWLRFEDVVNAGSVRAAVEATGGRTASVVADALVAAYPERSGRPSAALVWAHVANALSRSSTWLYVDALDERPVGRGSDVAAALRSLAGLECWIVLTSRPYTFDPRELSGFGSMVEYELAPLTRSQRRQFVGRWFDQDEARRLQVVELVSGDPPVTDLATNGLLLTLICATATDRRRPFERTTSRVQLYEWAVRDMVRRAHREDPLADDDPGVDQRLLVLREAAWQLYKISPDRQFSFEAWDDALEAACDERRLPESGLFRRELTRDLKAVGFLVSPTSGHWMFLHRTFLEYLAAAGLAKRTTPETVTAIARHVTDPRWREVILLTVGATALRHGTRAAGKIVDGLIASVSTGPTVALMGEAVVEADSRISEELEEVDLRQALLTTMRDDAHVVAKTRASAGTALGRLGDPRFRQDAWYLPDEPLLGFVEIPAGSFTMGSDPDRDPSARENEQSAHLVQMSRFYIARYPVTVAQLRAYASDNRVALVDPGCLEGVANHPVVHVSWAEALAYCDWLTAKLQSWKSLPEELARGFRGANSWRATLPSEAEWEKAARGTDSRIYPWGDTLDPNRANFWASSDETVLRKTSAVGCFPAGVSPSQVEELSGNVWEWTRSLLREYPYQTEDGREDLTVGGLRVLRGGSFYDYERSVRVAFRFGFNPDDRSYGFGFRVALSQYVG